MRRIDFIILLALVSFTILTSCHKDEVLIDDTTMPESTTEFYEGGCEMRFAIPYVPRNPVSFFNINVKLYPIDNMIEPWSLTASIMVVNTYCYVTMNVLYVNMSSSSLPDGHYLFSMRDNQEYARYILEIVDSKVVNVVEPYDYQFKDISGDGSKASPFIINTSSDFKEFLAAVHSDPIHGIGHYFKQEADITLGSVDRGVQNVVFAGKYDGAGHTINNITYDAIDETCSKVGLFSELTNGAEVTNLNLQGIFNNINSKSDEKSMCGVLAGSVSGLVKVSNCKINTTISTSNNTYCGGLIGHIASGDITIDNIFIENVNITDSASSTGGIVGHISGGKVNISNITNTVHQSLSSHQEYNLLLRGKVDVGGVVGYVDNAIVDINDVEFIHVVDDENVASKRINATQSGAGGIIGCTRGSIVSVGNSTVVLTVGSSSTSYAGGIVGYCDSDLTLTDVTVSPYIEVDNYAGGLVGETTHLKTMGIIYVIPRFSSAAAVIASQYAGGLVGNGTGLKLNSGESIVMALAVGNSDSEYVGGLAGRVYDCEVSTNKLEMGDGSTENIKTSTILIQGAKYVGGLIGQLYNATLRGHDANVFDYNEGAGVTLPSKRRFVWDVNYIVRGDNYSGGAVGEMVEGSNIYNICSNATNDGDDRIGGIVGNASKTGNVIDCVNLNTVIVKNTSAGGICGYVDGNTKFLDCINFGTITGGQYIGGIVGYASWWDGHTDIDWCVNCGDVTGQRTVGGIISYYDTEGHWYYPSNSKNAYIVEIAYKCANYGTIKASNDDDGDDHTHSIGGIVGSAPNTKNCIKRCVNHGTVDGGDSAFGGVGGIVGSIGHDPKLWYEYDNCRVLECANFGTIKNTGNNTNTGGIVGYMEEGWNYNDSIIEDCYNDGIIQGDGDDGGLVGYLDSYGWVRLSINFGMVQNGGNAVCGEIKLANTMSSVYYVEGTGNAFSDCGAIEDPSDSTEYSAYFLGTDHTGSATNWEMGSKHPMLRNTPFQEVYYNK